MIMNLPDGILTKLLLSLLVGGLIGAEREYRSKSAGFRTLTLICIGATIFTVFSQILGDPGNRDRVASNIATGIGFVGAGVIFKGDFGVNGITTAAMIWVTAALGMAIGAGYGFVALISCAIILIMLLVFSKLEGWIDRVNQTRNYKIVCDYQNETLHAYEESFQRYHLKFKRSKEMKVGELITGEWIVKGAEKNHLNFIRSILNDPNVKQFEY
jgi:putative Mg2+ transporter-C (MgtC) family protein